VPVEQPRDRSADEGHHVGATSIDGQCDEVERPQADAREQRRGDRDDDRHSRHEPEERSQAARHDGERDPDRDDEHAGTAAVHRERDARGGDQRHSDREDALHARGPGHDAAEAAGARLEEPAARHREQHQPEHRGAHVRVRWKEVARRLRRLHQDERRQHEQRQAHRHGLYTVLGSPWHTAGA
jgi:hypothetical protein